MTRVPTQPVTRITTPADRRSGRARTGEWDWASHRPPTFRPQTRPKTRSRSAHPHSAISTDTRYPQLKFSLRPKGNRIADFPLTRRVIGHLPSTIDPLAIVVNRSSGTRRPSPVSAVNSPPVTGSPMLVQRPRPLSSDRGLLPGRPSTRPAAACIGRRQPCRFRGDDFPVGTVRRARNPRAAADRVPAGGVSSPGRTALAPSAEAAVRERARGIVSARSPDRNVEGRQVAHAESAPAVR
jgi:hypothetical protein